MNTSETGTIPGAKALTVKGQKYRVKSDRKWRKYLCYLQFLQLFCVMLA